MINFRNIEEQRADIHNVQNLAKVVYLGSLYAGLLTSTSLDIPSSILANVAHIQMLDSHEFLRNTVVEAVIKFKHPDITSSNDNLYIVRILRGQFADKFTVFGQHSLEFINKKTLRLRKLVKQIEKPSYDRYDSRSTESYTYDTFNTMDDSPF